LALKPLLLLHPCLGLQLLLEPCLLGHMRLLLLLHIQLALCNFIFLAPLARHFLLALKIVLPLQV